CRCSKLHSSNHNNVSCLTLLRPPRRPTLFPYTTLFRSVCDVLTSLPQTERRSTANETVAAVSSEMPAVNFELLLVLVCMTSWWGDRKSTRLNSSHVSISYAVFCLKKKKITMSDDIAHQL